jgi:hypothetical protein
MEGVMGLALLFLLGGVIIPRIVQASPDVRASHAMLLEHRLDQLYEAWYASGGVHGPGGTRDGAELTLNLLMCLTSPVGVPFASAGVTSTTLGTNGVLEDARLSPNPSHVRLMTFHIETPTPQSFCDDNQKSWQGIRLKGGFLAAFDGRHWHVVAAK